MSQRRAWTDRYGAEVEPKDVEDWARAPLHAKEPQKVADVPVKVKKRKKALYDGDVSGIAAALVANVEASRPDRGELVLEQPPAEAPLLQRPNAVRGRDGDPVLLNGLMLPLPPSSNRYWKDFLIVKKGTRFPFQVFSMKHLYQMVRHMNAPSPESEEYIERIRQLAMEKRFRFMTERDLEARILVCPRDRRSMDAHNYAKVLLDAFQHAGVYEDDAQVKQCWVGLGPIMEGGRVIVSLREITMDRDALLREFWG